MEKQRTFVTTQLGDSLNGSGRQNGPSLDVQEILKSEEVSGAVRHFAMESFPLKRMSSRPPATDEERRLLGELKRMAANLNVEREKVAQLSARLEREKSIAMEEGYSRGNREGLDSKEKELQDQYSHSVNELTTNLESVLNALSGEVPKLFLQFEKESAQLALGCVEKVFEEIASRYGTGIVSVVKKAVEVLGKSKTIHVRIHPLDLKAVENSKSIWLPLSKKVERLTVEEDERVARGSCVVDSNTTSVEMNLATIFQNMQREVEALFRSKSGIVGGAKGGSNNSAGEVT